MDEIDRDYLNNQLVMNEGYSPQEAKKDVKKFERLIVRLAGKTVRVRGKTYTISGNDLPVAIVQTKIVRMRATINQSYATVTKSVRTKPTGVVRCRDRSGLLPRIEETELGQISNKERKEVIEFIYKKYSSAPKSNLLSDDLVVNLFTLISKSDRPKLIDNLMVLLDLDFLEKYRGKQSGKYASDIQIARCPEDVQLSYYADYSCPETGALRSEKYRKFQDDWFERKGGWHFYFQDDGSFYRDPATLAGRNFYRPTRAGDMVTMQEKGILKPENWMYPGIINYRQEFSIVTNKIDEVISQVFDTPKRQTVKDYIYEV